VAELLASDVEAASFGVLSRLVRERAASHAASEERRVFPQVRRRVSHLHLRRLEYQMRVSSFNSGPIRSSHLHHRRRRRVGQRLALRGSSPRASHIDIRREPEPTPIPTGPTALFGRDQVLDNTYRIVDVLAAGGMARSTSPSI